MGFRNKTIFPLLVKRNSAHAVLALVNLGKQLLFVLFQKHENKFSVSAMKALRSTRIKEVDNGFLEWIIRTTIKELFSEKQTFLLACVSLRKKNPFEYTRPISLERV